MRVCAEKGSGNVGMTMAEAGRCIVLVLLLVLFLFIFLVLISPAHLVMKESERSENE